ncbi:hypothetical protein KCN56_09125 [Photobacterium galatheae]|uniref:hypothetical protein n=1 Tax=Photobacterium galatheae TaxID=1654360 RepID=UPI00202CB020|nr:hypothetical protein [Photobacterium galatheae]MCM0148720.1 hypothetical protein [Photobacterium galatheae]
MNNKNHQQYQKIRDSIIDDIKFTTDAERLAEFMNSYCNIIKKEKPLIAWEKNQWDKGLRGFFILFFLFSMSISSAIYFLGNEYQRDAGLTMAIGLTSIQTFLMLLGCYPEKYQHRITTSGIYVRSYRRGKAIRQGTLRIFLLLAIPTVIGLFLIMGPMVFAGAGAGALGVFSMASLFREKEPEEMALPWESIFFIRVINEEGFFSKEKGFRIQFRFDLVCDDSNFDEVKELLDSHKLDQMIYIQDIFADTRTEKFEKLLEHGKRDIPFLVK